MVALVGNACLGSSIAATLNQTGTYAVLASEHMNDGTMAYALALQCLAGSCVVAPTPDISGCIDLRGSPLANRPVLLRQSYVPAKRTTTDVNGCYAFENIVSGKSFSVTIQGPVAP
jgi:hypothetical protein